VVIYAFANNHFSGHAPATIEQFRNLWQQRGFPALSQPQAPPPQQQNSLFPD
jgi:uncharacterized protein YecE (DUF72 family)